MQYIDNPFDKFCLTIPILDQATRATAVATARANGFSTDMADGAVASPTPARADGSVVSPTVALADGSVVSPPAVARADGSVVPPPAVARTAFQVAASLPTNLGRRSTTAAGHCNQVAHAAGNIGTPVRFLAGTRTRNPDQVDVIDQMNQQMRNGMEQLRALSEGLQPTDAERRRDMLQDAIKSSLDRMTQMTANGIDTSSLRNRIETLQGKLDEHLDTMLGI